jgi:hypothetical protein
LDSQIESYDDSNEGSIRGEKEKNIDKVSDIRDRSKRESGSEGTIGRY